MSKGIFKNVHISGISCALPTGKLHIDDYVKKYNKGLDFINSIDTMGYGFSYFLQAGVTMVDLCEKAACSLIKSMNIDVHSIDAVIFVNQFPDNLSPSSSHILHNRLKLPYECSVFDVAIGAHGYVYGLFLASAMISNGLNRIMLLAGENITEDRVNISSDLFLSSSGSASLIEKSEDDINSYFLLYSDGSKYEDIIMPAGAYRMPVNHNILDTEIFDKKGIKWNLKQKIYNKKKFYDYLVTNIDKYMEEMFNFSGKTQDDIDFFAFNQVNKPIVDKLAEKLNISNNKYNSADFTKYGNQGINSCITNMLEYKINNKYSSKGLSAFIGYGEGISTGISLINVATKHLMIKEYDFPNPKTLEEIYLYWEKKLANNK